MEMTSHRTKVEGFTSGDMSRGEHLYGRDCVEVHVIGDGGALGTVAGNWQDAYVVGLDFESVEKGALGISCECMRFEEFGACKHAWAMLLECRNYDLPFDFPRRLDVFECDAAVIQIGQRIRVKASESTRADSRPAWQPRVKRSPKWKRQLEAVSRLGQTQAGASLPETHGDLGVDRQYIYAISLSDYADFGPLLIRTYETRRKKNREWGKPSQCGLVTHGGNISDPRERASAAMLAPLNVANDYGFYRPPLHGCERHFNLRPELIRETLGGLAATGRLVWVMDAGSHLNPDDAKTLSFEEGPSWSLRVSMRLSRTDQGKERIIVRPFLHRDGECLDLANVVAVSSEGVVLREDRLGIVPPQQAALVRGWQEAGVIDVAARNLASLLKETSRWQHVELDLDPNLPIDRASPPPSPILRLSTPQQGSEQLRAEVRMKYDDVEFGFGSPSQSHWDDAERRLISRDREAEASRLAELPAEQFSRDRDASQLEIPRRSLPTLVSELTRRGWDVVADGSALRRAGSFHIEVESGQDWFDVNAKADFGGQTVALPELLRARRNGQRFVVLDDGSHGILPEQWLAKFDCLESAGEVEDETIRFRKSQALLLDAMLDEQENVSLDRAFKAWCEKLNSFSGITPQAAPDGFQGELREYQQLGLGWLHFLNDFRLGGCLADDMGLGKTVQVLSLLEARRTRQLEPGETKRPSLVVAPKSLVFNWVEEAARFTPELNVLNYTGSERKHSRESMTDFDAIVTTYGTLRNDAMILREVEFDHVILDEAQAIKNPAAKAAKAARLMNAEHRLGMTGTPVENHLGDLWSLFDFLNPGMLGQTLGRDLANAEEQNGERLRQVAKALRPFILRRTKQEVLSELPEKTEQTLHCDMEPKQRKLYAELKNYYRDRVTKQVRDAGIAQSKMHVLEALLRLRQAACDPRLVNSDCGVPGAKLTLLMEQLEELIGEDHKALVFSQFTSLLTLLRQELDAKGWTYEYLDGKTRKRNERVKRFQEDPECQLFLISLKAGGHGLNLTAADYVYILDPWWNPAVEAQAVDRAHRIGQTQPVNAYRLICRGTVEEKIADLQASKRKLADAIISQKQSVISDLSADDLKMLFE